jgi:hypothetical protein
MAKSYSKQLGEWVKARESPKRDRNLVAFLAVRDDVQVAIDEGFTLKTIWTNLHEVGRIRCGYHTFRNYVNKHLRAIPAGRTEELQTRHRQEKAPVAASPSVRRPGAQPKGQDGAAGFTFNPVPNKEELL